jgi:hypothetical protein
MFELGARPRPPRALLPLHLANPRCSSASTGSYGWVAPDLDITELHHLLLDDLAVLLTERFGQGMSVECRSD